MLNSYLFFYLFIFNLNLIFSFYNQNKLPKNYNIYTPEKTYNIKIVNGKSIYNSIINICNITTKAECIMIMDQISTDYYGIEYTPSRLTSTIEDFYGKRTDILKYLSKRYDYKSYLEIGCDLDENFEQVKTEFTTVVGVDPISGGTHRMTSDEFFQQNDQLFDLIYIDGDHKSEQVWKDITNSLLFLKEGGTIVLHDLNPRLEERQNPEQEGTGKVWNGDAWKAAVAFRLVSDYEIIVVDIDHGCGIIRKRPNQHPLLEAWQRGLIEIGPLPNQTLPGTHSLEYIDLEEHREQILRLMSLVEMREWLEES